jgi:hypothetical protein
MTPASSDEAAMLAAPAAVPFRKSRREINLLMSRSPFTKPEDDNNLYTVIFSQMTGISKRVIVVAVLRKT